MGAFGSLLKIIPLDGLYTGFYKMPVPPALKELTANSVSGASPVNYLRAKISFPPSHPPAKRRYGIQPAVTFTENNMIAHRYTDYVAVFSCFNFKCF